MVQSRAQKWISYASVTRQASGLEVGGEGLGGSAKSLGGHVLVVRGHLEVLGVQGGQVHAHAHARTHTHICVCVSSGFTVNRSLSRKGRGRVETGSNPR